MSRLEKEDQWFVRSLIIVTTFGYTIHHKESFWEHLDLKYATLTSRSINVMVFITILFHYARSRELRMTLHAPHKIYG